MISLIILGCIGIYTVYGLHHSSLQTFIDTNHIELTREVSTTSSLYDHHSLLHSSHSKFHSKPFTIHSSWFTTIIANNKFFYPVVDTGSSDIILYSKKVKNNDKPIRFDYISHTISVYPDKATLEIGNINYKATIGWSSTTSTSILGLGLPKLSMLDPSLALTTKLNTITLSYKPDYSYIDFNKNPTVYMLYTTVEGNTYWDVYLHQIFMDHILLSNIPTTATIDTGTAIIRGPLSKIISILHVLEHYQNNTKWDCENVDHLPIFYFEVGKPFSSPKNGLSGTITLELEPWYYMQYIGSTCLPAFAVSEGNEWIFGEPFLYKYKILLDIKNRKVGFSDAYYTRSIEL